MSYRTIKLELAIHGRKHSNLIFKNNEASSKMQNIDAGRLKDALYAFLYYKRLSVLGAAARCLGMLRDECFELFNG